MRKSTEDYAKTVRMRMRKSTYLSFSSRSPFTSEPDFILLYFQPYNRLYYGKVPTHITGVSSV
jgi:hypothetical protein